MSKYTGELIKKKSINLCCQPIFSYISSLIIVPNALFSQSLSQYYDYNNNQIAARAGTDEVSGASNEKHTLYCIFKYNSSVCIQS